MITFNNKKYCDCGILITNNDKVCMWCKGFTKQPLGPEAKPYSVYRWIKQ